MTATRFGDFQPTLTIVLRCESRREGLAPSGTRAGGEDVFERFDDAVPNARLREMVFFSRHRRANAAAFGAGSNAGASVENKIGRTVVIWRMSADGLHPVKLANRQRRERRRTTRCAIGGA